MTTQLGGVVTTHKLDKVQAGTASQVGFFDHLLIHSWTCSGLCDPRRRTFGNFDS